MNNWTLHRKGSCTVKDAKGIKRLIDWTEWTAKGHMVRTFTGCPPNRPPE